jgi:hypothetical protein
MSSTVYRAVFSLHRWVYCGLLWLFADWHRWGAAAWGREWRRHAGVCGGPGYYKRADGWWVSEHVVGDDFARVIRGFRNADTALQFLFALYDALIATGSSRATHVARLVPGHDGWSEQEEDETLFADWTYHAGESGELGVYRHKDGWEVAAWRVGEDIASAASRTSARYEAAARRLFEHYNRLLARMDERALRAAGLTWSESDGHL